MSLANIIQAPQQDCLVHNITCNALTVQDTVLVSGQIVAQSVSITRDFVLSSTQLDITIDTPNVEGHCTFNSKQPCYVAHFAAAQTIAPLNSFKLSLFTTYTAGTPCSAMLDINGGAIVPAAPTTFPVNLVVDTSIDNQIDIWIYNNGPAASLDLDGIRIFLVPYA